MTTSIGPSYPQNQPPPAPSQADPARAPDADTPGLLLPQLDLSRERWCHEFKENKSKLWVDTPEGRVKARLFARGVLGAAAFTWAGYYAGGHMRDYNPHGPVKNWVQGIARFYDVAAGTPIKTVVNLLGHDGEKFLTCAPTRTFDGYLGKKGCSLGHKVVNVTFDFGAMSIGDYWGRTLVNAFDPGVKHEWVNEDGSVNPLNAAKVFAKNWWTAITYASGEDWMVAVPYVLAMEKIGTPAMNRLSPGYRLDFDNNGLGGSLLVNDSGKVVNNFTQAGVADLVWRFATYNGFTKFFRRSYLHLGHRLDQLLAGQPVDPLIEPDPDHPQRSLTETAAAGAQQFGRFLARDTVEAGMYMAAAAPIFAVLRVPQHKYRGYFIHPEKGMLMYGEARDLHPLRAHTLDTDPHFNHLTPVFFKNTGERAINPFGLDGFDPHAKTYGVADTLLTPIGKLSDRLREQLNPLGDWLNSHAATVKRLTGVEMDVSPLGGRKLRNGHAITNTLVNASLAYTPYFMMKTDLAGRTVATGRTDIAVERMNKGLFTLNMGEFRAGASEIYESIFHQKLSDPAREKAAQTRISALALTPPPDPEEEADEAPEIKRQRLVRPASMPAQPGSFVEALHRIDKHADREPQFFQAG